MRTLNLFLLLAFAYICFVSCDTHELINDSKNHTNYNTETTRTGSPVIARMLFENEKDYLRERFPNLCLDGYIVIGEASTTYNCIAFSLGRTDTWINPPSSAQQFKALYENAGTFHFSSNNFIECSNSEATVEGWGFDTNFMTHASIKYGSDWASKLGGFLCITHSEMGLVGSTYGSPLLYFKPCTTTRQGGDIQVNNEYISLEDSLYVINYAEKTDAILRNRFELVLKEWMYAIHTNPTTKLSPSTLTYTQLPEFKNITLLGKNILPLIIEKLTARDNFPVLVLYDTLQDDENLKIKYTENDSYLAEGEQNRAVRTIRLWVKNERKRIK